MLIEVFTLDFDMNKQKSVLKKALGQTKSGII